MFIYFFHISANFSRGYLYILSLQHDFTKDSLIVPTGDLIFSISATITFTFVIFNEMSFTSIAAEFGSDIYVPLRMNSKSFNHPLNGRWMYREGIGNYFHHFSKFNAKTFHGSSFTNTRICHFSLDYVHDFNVTKVVDLSS